MVRRIVANLWRPVTAMYTTITGGVCGRIYPPITNEFSSMFWSGSAAGGHHVDQDSAVLAAVHALAALDPAFRGAFGHGRRLRAAHDWLLRDGRLRCLHRTMHLKTTW